MLARGDAVAGEELSAQARGGRESGELRDFADGEIWP